MYICSNKLLFSCVFGVHEGYDDLVFGLFVCILNQLRGYLAVVILDIAGDKQSEGESEEFELDGVVLEV